MSLKDAKQQNIQMELDFSSALTGETRKAGREETEAPRGDEWDRKPSQHESMDGGSM